MTSEITIALIGGLVSILVAWGTAYFTTALKFSHEKKKMSEDWRSKILDKYYHEFESFQKLAQQFAIGIIYYEDHARTGHHQKIFIPKNFNMTVGRSENNDIVSYDLTVSRYHAMISSNDSKVYIEDLFPTNKTLINGKEIKKQTELKDDDEIQFGKTTMKFKYLNGWL